MGDARGSRLDCLPSGMRERQALYDFAACCTLRVDLDILAFGSLRNILCFVTHQHRLVFVCRTQLHVR